MENFINDLPYFLFFVFLGISVNFLYTARHQRITRGRIAREFLGGIWISLIMYGVLDEFFNLTTFFVYVICSVAGFGNSRIIDSLQKDFFEFLVLQLKEIIKGFVSRIKSKSHVEENYHTPKFPEDKEFDKHHK